MENGFEMSKQSSFNRWLACTVLVLVAAHIATANPPQADKKIRIVHCEDSVQSLKRGVAGNRLDAEDFRALAPGVSWWYNWHYKTEYQPPKDVKIEFLPMVWGDHAESIAGLKAGLEAGQKPRKIFLLNEPNLRGQAFITPQKTADVYLRVKAIADPYGVSVCGPHMALGSSANDSIKAYDPMEKKEITYTYMVPFLKAFFHYVGQEKVAGIGYHTYGNIDEFRWSVGEIYKQFKRPVWVTEYAWWGAANVQDAKKYLIQSTDLLERSPFVEGYAWFKERADNDRISLLDKKPGQLSTLGQAYVQMPVHDKDLYYRIPGRLEAERYVSMKNMEIYPTSDSDGFTEMSVTKADAWMDYNIYVPQAGTFRLAFRTGGVAGKIQILRQGKVLATVTATKRTWETLETKIVLPAGAQTLRVRFSSVGQTVNWMEFGDPAPSEKKSSAVMK